MSRKRTSSSSARNARRLARKAGNPKLPGKTPADVKGELVSLTPDEIAFFEKSIAGLSEEMREGVRALITQPVSKAYIDELIAQLVREWHEKEVLDPVNEKLKREKEVLERAQALEENMRNPLWGSF